MTDAETPRGKAAETTGSTRTGAGTAGAGSTARTDTKGRPKRRTPRRYVRGYQGEGGNFAPTNTHRGRLGSWIAVAVFFVGFLLAGIGLSVGVNWWLIGIGGGLMAVGGILFLVTDIFTDVVLDDPHQESEEPHNTPLHRIKSTDRRIAETEEGHRAAADDLPGDHRKS
ncbi:pro-sigmaK processing inhibitor BofA family protein [Streptomonospora litoralis]|uniref:Uncharacterized protein n=1 Tax=Streptomonospora litoralis TaxID=2498135 RepID=A0A4P6Q1Z6_9ACTN|nr:pro-sigmaK processing inhibitor BofA family protein [Streptomonospora litoralis]QBI52754.1 hypothetical protein EKD16_04735 [Streptomonospora litoralis]